jgi:hypothetical protein
MRVLALLLASFAPLAPSPKPLPLQSAAAVAQFRPTETCELMEMPEPTNSPHPMFFGVNHAVVVDFIIGYDGQVYSPFVLESSDEAASREVMRLVKTWRFHPATCNHVPIDVEGKVVFFSH